MSQPFSPAHPDVDDRAAELIAARVAAALRAELLTLIASIGDVGHTASGMTVDQVASRLGVARSTVYAHWREWGGYKLGHGDKAPIRFDQVQLPQPTDLQRSAAPTGLDSSQRRRRPRRKLITDAPRFIETPDEVC